MSVTVEIYYATTNRFTVRAFMWWPSPHYLHVANFSLPTTPASLTFETLAKDIAEAVYDEIQDNAEWYDGPAVTMCTPEADRKNTHRKLQVGDVVVVRQDFSITLGCMPDGSWALIDN